MRSAIAYPANAQVDILADRHVEPALPVAVYVMLVTQASFGRVGAKLRFRWLSLPSTGVRKFKDPSAGFANLAYFADFF